MKFSNRFVATIVLFLVSLSAIAGEKPYKGVDPNIDDSHIINDMHTSISCKMTKAGVLLPEKVWNVDIWNSGRTSTFIHKVNNSEKYSGSFDACLITAEGNVSCNDAFYGDFDIKFASKEVWVRRCNALDRIGGCYEKLFIHFDGIAKKQNLKLECKVGGYPIP